MEESRDMSCMVDLEFFLQRSRWGTIGLERSFFTYLDVGKNSSGRID